jgi:hypothetical protein
MADACIDFDETRIYGEYAIEQIAHHLAGRLREFDPALHLAVTALRVATDTVAQQLHQARSVDPELHQATLAREVPLAEAREVIVRFARHLESHRAGSVPYGAFFVESASTLSQRGPQRMLAALDHVLGSLDELGGPVREHEYWRDEISRARHGLDVVLAADQRVRARPVQGAGLEAARQHWLRIYEANKHLVAAVLALSGSNVPMDEIFDDLADVHHAEGARDGEPTADVA